MHYGTYNVPIFYKSETVGNLIKNLVDRFIEIKKLIDKLGGKLISFYYSCADYDGIITADLPNNA